MTATILVVDDEPDLEALVLQEFRRQIRDGAVTFVFAHDGIEALQSLEQHPQTQQGDLLRKKRTKMEDACRNTGTTHLSDHGTLRS